MRTSYDPKLLEENGKIIGISLGADFCAEHEWGIPSLKRTLGIDSTKWGIEGRKAAKCGDANIFYVETPNEVLLVVAPSYYIERYRKEFDKTKNLATAMSHSGISCGAEVNCAWDEGGFLVHVDLESLIKSTKKDKINPKKAYAFVKDLYAAMQKQDFAIWLGGGGLFQNAGLCLVIASQVSKTTKDAFYAKDKDYADLLDAAKATTIEQRLRDAGKKWFALSPRWKDNDTKSKHKVIFWLNPMEQHKHNYGWMTVEDLEDWIKGTGKIPMSPEMA